MLPVDIRFLSSSLFFVLFLLLSFLSASSSPFLFHPERQRKDGRKRLLEPEGLIGTKFKEKEDETER